jgi:hypothetical protein
VTRTVRSGGVHHLAQMVGAPDGRSIPIDNLEKRRILLV